MHDKQSYIAAVNFVKFFACQLDKVSRSEVFKKAYAFALDCPNFVHVCQHTSNLFTSNSMFEADVRVPCGYIRRLLSPFIRRKVDEYGGVRCERNF